MRTATVTYCLVNNLGGITTMLQNLVKYRGAGSLQQEAIVLSVRENKSAPIEGNFSNDIPCMQLNFSNKENWYHVFKKLARHSAASPGVLVANDVFEMIMLTHYNIPKKVVQIVHDGYNVKLAVQYGEVVDKFICHSFFFYEVMQQLFPSRRNDIVFIPYGIPVTGYKRKPLLPGEPLKLFFLGRHDELKGIFDLIEIEKLLQQAQVPAHWLILGRGPQTAALKQQWEGKSNVVFETPATNEEVLKAVASRDVFVFPTRFEGFPVSLVEAMSTGCVPVASNLPGGLRELVKENINGFLCEKENPAAFAEKIIWLHHHRQELESMSDQAAAIVASDYNVTSRSPQYQQFFKQVADMEQAPAHHSIKRKLGSRLDHPWIPNAITKLARKA